MERLVSILSNNNKVVFDQGRFDNWCVYLVQPNGKRHAPTDNQYFAELLQISRYYKHLKVYTDFILISKHTTNTIDNKVLNLITQLSGYYQKQHRPIIEQWFTVIYASMIAEENKANSKLKKRIKHLGIYQVLVLGMPVQAATKFSYGKKWPELHKLMQSYGI